MNDDLIRNLFSAYPEIFTPAFLKFYSFTPEKGVKCGSGWYNLICEVCENLNKSAIINDEPPIALTALKEKVGLLRFVVKFCSETQREIINSIEEKSAYVCEMCGSPGALNSFGAGRRVRCFKHLNVAGWRIVAR